MVYFLICWQTYAKELAACRIKEINKFKALENYLEGVAVRERILLTTSSMVM